MTQPRRQPIGWRLAALVAVTAMLGSSGLVHAVLVDHVLAVGDEGPTLAHASHDHDVAASSASGPCSLELGDQHAAALPFEAPHLHDDKRKALSVHGCPVDLLVRSETLIVDAPANAPPTELVLAAPLTPTSHRPSMAALWLTAPKTSPPSLRSL